MRKKIKNAESVDSHRKNLFLFISILAVVAVSGCIVPGGDVFQGIFAPQRPATTEASADLITVQNTNIIPNPPISASTDASNTNGFTVSFEVKNNDEKQEVDNVAVEKYDTGKCNFVGEGTVPTGGGGVSGIVKQEENTTVAFFDVTCPDGTKKRLGFETGMEIDSSTVGLCNLAVPVKVYEPTKNLEDIAIKIGSSGQSEEQTIHYAEYETDKQYFCRLIYSKNPNFDDSRCMAQFKTGVQAGLKMKFVNIDRSVGRTSCVNSDCVNNCRKTCADKNNIIDRISSRTPCLPYYDTVNSYGFNGYCCSCKAGTRLSDTITQKTTSVTGDTFMPLQTELREWQFIAPSNDDLGNMPGSCGIKYKITYDFTAKTQASIDVINADKLSQMQRAGETPSSSPVQSVGIGPIKVFFDFGAKQPVRSRDVLPIFVTVEDRGSGLLDSGDILSGSLKLEIPQDFTEVSCSKFTNSAGEYSNTATIPMIKKKSPQLRCSFTMPDVTDIKTFYISASLDYTYKLDNQIRVSVNPTLVR